MPVKYSFYFIVLLVAFTACKNNQQEIARLNLVKENLDISIKNWEMTNKVLYQMLSDKLSSPYDAEIAMIWQPRGLKIQSLSANIYNYIDGLKAGIKNNTTLKKIESNELYKKLNNYQRDLLNIDPSINARFKERLRLISQNETDFYTLYFKNNSSLSTVTILSSLQNNIKITENQTATFCYNQIGHLDGEGFFTKFSAIVCQNSNHLKAGDVLEINAGVGEFSVQSQPRISINGKNVECVNAVANYKLKVSDKSGKHSIPVKIEYTNQNGEHQFMTKDIEYTVDE